MRFDVEGCLPYSVSALSGGWALDKLSVENDGSAADLVADAADVCEWGSGRVEPPVDTAEVVLDLEVGDASRLRDEDVDIPWPRV